MIKFLLFIITLVLFQVAAFGQVNEIPKYKISDVKLYNEIVKMDSIYFNAYNSCDMDTQLNLYDENIEFFDDKGGL